MRHNIDIVYSGQGYCVFPGDPYAVPEQYEKKFKEIAATSERGIDWEAEQVAERVGDLIIRGVRIKVDPWLFKIYKQSL